MNNSSLLVRNTSLAQKRKSVKNAIYQVHVLFCFSHGAEQTTCMHLSAHNASENAYPNARTAV